MVTRMVCSRIQEREDLALVQDPFGEPVTRTIPTSWYDSTIRT
jgi:hypothetical protein